MAADQAQATIDRPEDGRFFSRLFYVFVTLAVLSLGISLAGKEFGHFIVMAGNTDARTTYRIRIGDDALSVPANMIRFETARRDGEAKRVDLYVHWPDMQGYTLAARDDFDNRSGVKRILFMTVKERDMSRDMSGRFDPIYSGLVERPGTAGPSGITFYRFNGQSGYLNEELAVAPRPGQDTPFVARCLYQAASVNALADCERDIQFGENLQLRYRFPRELIDQWSDIDRAVEAFASEHLVQKSNRP